MTDDQSLMRIADNLSIIAKTLDAQTKVLIRIAEATERTAGDGTAISRARTMMEGD